MKSLLQRTHKYYSHIIVSVVILIGIVLRFYRLGSFATFLGDQARDAIVIKRILFGEHFPAIGPSMSIGQVFLGPFFYYFMAPWLAIFQFNPVGLAYGVAFFSSLYLIINYLLVSQLFNKTTALISTIIITFSYTLIEFSRFSWNPNMLPLFIFLTIFFFIKSVSTYKPIYFIIAGAFLAFSIQLHYLALLLSAPLGIIGIIELFENRKKLKTFSIGVGSMIASFLFFSLPLIIFDLRHNFLNSRNFLSLFENTSYQSGDKISSFISTINGLDKALFNITPPLLIGLIPFVIFIIVGIIMRKNKPVLYLTICTIFITFILSFYGGPRYPHYFASLIPLYILNISFVLSLISKNNIGKVVIAVLLIFFIYVNSQSYYYFSGESTNQIANAKDVAKTMYDNVTKKSFNVTSLPLNYNSLEYRYYLELWHKKPIEQDSAEKTDELFVSCDEACEPIGQPQWEIANFAPRKIVGTWIVHNVTIYKLIR